MITLAYRTYDGQADYKFRFELVGGNWQAYIVQQPDYRGRLASDHASHRLGLGRTETPRVCWTKPLPSLEQAKEVAALWADHTQAYIATGTFPPPGALDRPTVTDDATATYLIEKGLRDMDGSPEGTRAPTGARTHPWLGRLRELIG